VATTVIFDDSEDILDIRLDNVFKAVFAKDTPNSKIALSRLVSNITYRRMNLPGASSWVSKISLRNICVYGGTNPPHPQLPQQAAGY